MTLTPSSTAVLKFFFKDGATSALFSWLNFRRFVERKELKLSPVSAAGSSGLTKDDRQSASPTDYLSQWELQASSNAMTTQPVRWLFPVLGMVVFIMGFGAMAGVLNYSGPHPINIWVPLAIFSFIPFLLTAISAFFSVVKTPANLEHGHPWLMLLVNKLHLKSFLPYKNVLLPWLLWKTQAFAILFSVAALLSFFVLATFQDYQFGWSSTLISDNVTMVNIMRVVSWPWQWFIAAPTEELINITRYSSDTMAGHSVEENWWLTLVMAIVFYGLLPRVLLAIYLRQRFVTLLKKNILNSGDVEQFVVAQKHQTSTNPIDFNGELPLPEDINIQQENADLIAWQQSDLDFPVIRNLGAADWEEDAKWLNSDDSRCDHPILLLVDPLQIPTGELADCIDSLKTQNDSVTLVLLPMGKVLKETSESRYAQQLKSWLYFSQRHDVKLKRGV